MWTKCKNIVKLCSLWCKSTRLKVPYIKIIRFATYGSLYKWSYNIQVLHTYLHMIINFQAKINILKSYYYHVNRAPDDYKNHIWHIWLCSNNSGRKFIADWDKSKNALNVHERYINFFIYYSKQLFKIN